MKIYRSFSSAETKRLALRLAQKIKYSKPSKKSLILALTGELGSGKTTFVQGFLKGMGIRQKITSPTFILVKSYKLKVKNFNRVYHIDAYRIKKPSELKPIGLKRILDDPRNIVLIEWADKIKKILPKKTIRLEFKHGQKENERTISTNYEPLSY